MWQKDFATRLADWQQLRSTAQGLPPLQAVEAINHWWQNSPWQSYYLHWDDFAEWPDPWQLLADNMFCELARALGIVYTVSLLERDDINSLELVLTEQGNSLVLYDEYILNWDPQPVVNTDSALKITRRITQEEIRQKYR